LSIGVGGGFLQLTVFAYNGVGFGFMGGRLFFAGHCIDFEHGVVGFFVDGFAYFLLYLFLLFEVEAVEGDEVFLGFADAFEFFFDDGVGDVVFAVGAAHAVDVEGVDHLSVLCFGADLFSDGLFLLCGFGGGTFELF
jgi:hypothetical protein